MICELLVVCCFGLCTHALCLVTKCYCRSDYMLIAPTIAVNINYL